ncbi:VOC family protein [Nocardia rhamnosiphila]|uniref:VOC family protein n=1 Tax=Nocardia rhamnosiphila TaxID=426716 RepID=UPI003F4CBD5B
MAPVKQIQVTFDCAEPEHVARFRSEVLGYEHQGSACVDPSGAGPRLYFQRVPEGKVVKNRLHLDVRVGTGLVGAQRVAALEAECARLVALGAVRVRLLLADDHNESCLVMQDIEGNEFCLDRVTARPVIRSGTKRAPLHRSGHPMPKASGP